MTKPFDLIGYYLSPTQKVGRFKTEDQIIRSVSKMPLLPALNILAQIANLVEKAKNKNDEKLLARQILKPRWANIACTNIDRGKQVHLMSSQVVAVLALYCVAHHQVIGDSTASQDPKEIGELLMAVAGMINTRIEGISLEEAALELARTDLWHQRNQQSRWYEMAHKIVFNVIPSIEPGESSDWIDVIAVIEDEVGMSIDSFWAITTSIGLAAPENVNSHIFPQYPSPNFPGVEVVNKAVRAWSSSIEEARANAREDLSNHNLWSFSTFFDKPLIDIGGGQYMSINPTLTAKIATPLGFFNFVEGILRKNGGDTLKWTRYFGFINEKLCRKLLNDSVSYLNRIDEDGLKNILGPFPKGTTKKMCDSLFLGPSRIGIDFVYRRIKKSTATTGTIKDLLDDLNKVFAEKLLQIDSTFLEALVKLGEPRGRYAALVITGAPFPVNAYLYNQADILIKSKAKIIGDPNKCLPPVLMTVEEFWLLLQLSRYFSIHPFVLVAYWLQSDMATASFHNWWATRADSKPPVQLPYTYIAHTAKYLLGDTSIHHLEQLVRMTTR